MGVTLIRGSMPILNIVCIPMGEILCFTIRNVKTCGYSNVITPMKGKAALRRVVGRSRLVPLRSMHSRFVIITSHSRLSPRARACVTSLGGGRNDIRLVSDKDSVGVYLITRNDTSICPHFTPAVR